MDVKNKEISKKKTFDRVYSTLPIEREGQSLSLSLFLEARCRVIILSSKYLRMDDRTTACSTTLVTHTVRADFTRRHRWLSRRGHYEAGWSQLLARHFHTMPPAAPFPYHTETRSRFSHALPFFRNTVASSRSVTPPPIWVRYDAQKFSPPFVYSNLEMKMDKYSNRIY